ncbi:MAG TPA: methionyl aminopeptidase [Spirochaetota bacterium]|nr:methionyl aminopeptidase [Spirochaetota bacterium]HPI88869.1 methionyl aminopeptidase [Spirochaetota bacterium]HPR47001.1 methionyl aminopeptidase [Spirochaetota bacterium]
MRKLSRNDPCWCGSGKKYKKCHMQSDLERNKMGIKEISLPKGVILKTKQQIEGIRRSSQLTREILDYVEERIKDGITTNEIDRWVHEYTISHGAIPATLGYNGYPKSVCTSLNNVICHGIPDETVLKEGDIINVDVTSILDGYYGDASRMFMIGNVTDEAKKLVHVAHECLLIGIEQARPYEDIGEIGYAIEEHAAGQGFSVVRDYGGHGIGLKFHEEPHVHHFGSRKRGITLVPGMTFTIEPMINAGRHESRLLKDGWTAVTIDGSLSAQWEHTIVVTEEGVEILTA